MEISEMFERLWTDYQKMNPQAAKIHELLEAKGEKVINDHVAFRGFEGQRSGIQAMSSYFLKHGYTQGENL